jgi:hypothetical protein
MFHNAVPNAQRILVAGVDSPEILVSVGPDAQRCLKDSPVIVEGFGWESEFFVRIRARGADANIKEIIE